MSTFYHQILKQTVRWPLIHFPLYFQLAQLPPTNQRPCQQPLPLLPLLPTSFPTTVPSPSSSVVTAPVYRSYFSVMLQRTVQTGQTKLLATVVSFWFGLLYRPLLVLIAEDFFLNFYNFNYRLEEMFLLIFVIFKFKNQMYMNLFVLSFIFL